MADYFSLSAEEKREALGVASTQSGRPIHLLEKDVWVVWALKQLYQSPFAEHLTFKGGTSLSKAYNAIQRFSEDIDVTYDIRVIAGDLVSQTADGLPATRSQQKKWTDDIRERLRQWVATQMLPLIQQKLAETDRAVSARAEGETILIEYPLLAEGTGYIGPRIKIEFGARSTGEPFEMLPIKADAATYLEGVTFPECTARVMRAERTFWEKATAIHVFCYQSKLNGELYARHWYDVAQLDKAGIVTKALAERDIAKAVAAHKAVFFRENDIKGTEIDYAAAVTGALQLVPDGEARDLLATDYRKMLDDGLLPTGAESFEEIMASCGEIQERANAVPAPNIESTSKDKK